MSSRIFSLLVCVGCMAELFFAGGCAPASPASMTPPLQRVDRTQPGSVWVTSIGGKDTNDFWNPTIDTGEFSKAVEASIEKSGVVETVSHNRSGDYHLEANLRAMEQRGSDVKYKVLISWKMSTSSEHRIVWDADIVGTDNNSLANATRDNIHQAMDSLEAAIPLR